MQFWAIYAFSKKILENYARPKKLFCEDYANYADSDK